MTKPTIEALGRAALRNHDNNIARALPKFMAVLQKQDMIDDLGRYVLEGLAADMATEGRRGHNHVVSPEVSAAPSQPSAPDGSISVKAHKVKQHRRRTHEEREAAKRAMMASAEAIYEMQVEGRSLGGLAMGELREMKHRLVHGATTKLILGAEEVRAAVLLELIDQHCQVADQLMRVREAISAKQLNALAAQAQIEAPRRIEQAMAQAAAAMERNREIAA